MVKNMNLLLENCGIDHKTAENISSLFENGRMPHAIIFEGASKPAGLVAKALAKAAVCTSSGGRPCGKCSACIKAGAGSHPDIFLLDGDSDPRAFPVNMIRKIRTDAYIRPNEADCKIYLLLGIQNMSETSQNALLKILEEPPANIMFIMTAVSVSQLLPTVRSRSQIFTVTEASGVDFSDKALEIARAVIAQNESDLLFLLSDFSGKRDEFRQIINCLELIFRDALVIRSGGKSCLSGQSETAASLCGSLTRSSLLKLLEEIETVPAALDRNANMTILLTSFCAGLRSAAGR